MIRQMRQIALSISAISMSVLSTAFAQQITTFAGNGSEGFSGDGGPATEAQLHFPEDVFADQHGNVYIADYINHRIRKVTPNGTITTIAGNGLEGFSGDGGPATEASIDSPTEVCTDLAGNLYLTDSDNYRIRKVDQQGIITTVAGNGVTWGGQDNVQATETSLDGANGICTDLQGNLYIAERWKHRIRKVDLSGIITTVAGNGEEGYSGDGGAATDAQLNRPTGVFVTPSGVIYIADGGNNCIRKVDQQGIITTVAGNGVEAHTADGTLATLASIVRPHDVFVAPDGLVFFSTTSNLLSGADSHRIRFIDANGNIQTIAGNGNYFGDYTEGELATEASLNAPTGICFDLSGNLYIAAVKDNAIRKVNQVSPPLQQTGLALTLDGQGDLAKISGNFDFSTTNQITLEAWIKFDNTSNYQGVLASGLEYRLMIDPGFRPFWDAGIHSDMTANAFTLSPNFWYHYAMVIEGGVEARIYVDGQLVASDQTSIPQTLPDVSEFFIGDGETVDSYPFLGQIDDVRIWNVARTQQQLQDHMKTRLSGSETGLIAYYTFDTQNLIDHTGKQSAAQLIDNAHLSASTAPLSGDTPQPPDPGEPPTPVESNWSIVETGLQDIFYAVQFIDANRGWAVGGKGQILSTTDGGASGMLQGIGLTSTSLFGLHFTDAQNGWVVGDRGVILHTQDGGNTWHPQTSNTTLRLYDVQFIDAQTGWAVGDWRTVLHTTDGGNTWTEQPTPSFSGNHLNAIHMINANTGWATASTSTGSHSVIATHDGGTTWTTLLDETGPAFGDLFFISATKGWIVGANGLILQTQDGGNTWHQQPTGVEARLLGVHFVTEQMGWAVGDLGVVLQTTDGGNTWYQQAVETTLILTDVFVSHDQTYGWISGAEGLLLAFGNNTTPPQPSGPDILVPQDFATIQAAIFAAEPGQTVRVAPGTYVENISLKEGVAVIGAGADSTMIDGNGSDVVWGANNARISGFTITNGGDSGVFAWSSSPTIENCIIVNSEQGIATAADPIIRGNIIGQNTGWGIFVGSSSTIGRPAHPTIVNNLIIANGTSAPGMTLFEAGGTIINNTIDSNGDTGIRLSPSQDLLTLEIRNNLITNNGGYGIRGYTFEPTSQMADYNNVWNNASGNYDTMQPGSHSAEADPLYVKPITYDTALPATKATHETASARNRSNDMRINGTASRRKITQLATQQNVPDFDYHLQSASTCIDAGDPSPLYSDQDGSRNDMGAYGGPHPFLIQLPTQSNNGGEGPSPGELPTGERGPIALDLDATYGDQQVVQTQTMPKSGDTITLDIVITEGGTGLNGFSLILTFDPAQVTYQGFSATDVFSGGIAIESKDDLASGSVGINVAFFGSTTTSKENGTLGQATFTVTEGFAFETQIAISSPQTARDGIPSDIQLGPGGTFVVIGGDMPTPSIPTDPVERSDFSGNGVVDFGDFITFASAFGKKSGDAGFDPRIDLNDNGSVDFSDFIQFAGLFGKSVGSGKPTP